MNTLLVMLPCYNEEKDLASLLEKWIAQREPLQALGYTLIVKVIDDKSTDGTLAIALDYHQRFPQVVGEPLVHEVNQNLGGGVNTAIAYALEHLGPQDLLCIMDGDDTQDPCFAPSMVEAAQHADVVIASRYCHSSQVKGVPPLRLFLSNGARFYYKLVLGVPGVEDYTCGYRIYHVTALQAVAERYGTKPLENRSFACMMELLYKLHRVGCRFAEVPFTLRYDNKQGSSKMQIFKTVRDSFFTAISIRHKA